MEAKRASFGSFLTWWTVLSLLISIPVFVLSIFNFGLICRGYNGALAIVTFGVSAILLFLQKREQLRLVAQASQEPIQDSLSDTQSVIKHTDGNQAIHGLPSSSRPGRPFSKDDIEFPVAYTMNVIIPLIILTLGYIVAFAIMVDITIRGGVASTLPAERDPKMTYPWNINVQIGQTAVIGAGMLVLGVETAVCVFGRMKIANMYQEKMEEIEYGFES